MPEQTRKSEQRLTPEQQARRRLLKLGAYVPPMILGMAIMTQTGFAFASGSNSKGGGGSGGSNGNDGQPSCSPNCCTPAGSNANRKGCDGGDHSGDGSDGSSGKSSNTN